MIHVNRRGEPSGVSRRLMKSPDDHVKVGQLAHRAKPDVDVGKADPEQAAPSPDHVLAVEAAHAVVEFLLRGRVRQLVAATADQVAERMAAEGIAAQENDVEQEDERADAEAEVPAALGVLESAALHEVPEEQTD